MSTRIASPRLNLVCAAVAALALLAGCSKNDSTQTAANEDAASNDAAAPPAGTQPADGADAGAPAQTTTAPNGVQVAQAPAPAPLPPRADRDEDVVPAPAPAAQGGGPSYVDDGGGVPSYADEDDGPQEVVSAYVDPPLAEPAPVEVAWAPPPMLVEEVPPQPGPDYVWTGGYWGWQGRWIWCAGRWSEPPRPHYRWQEPYYEHRGDRVVFVPAYWSPPDRPFVAPAVGVTIAVAIVATGLHHHGHPPEGPQGVFVPPPPGSRPGIIVPAPVGTPPAVVLGAPPLIHAGMRVEGRGGRGGRGEPLREVAIVAPQGATADGRPFQATVAAQPHPAPGLKPVVAVMAPKPTSDAAIPAYRPGAKPVALPPPQPVVRRGPLPVRPGEPAPAVAGRVPQPGTGPLTAHGERTGAQQADANAAWQAHERAEAAQAQQALRDPQAQRESQLAQARAQQQSQARLQQEAAAQQHAQQEAAQAQARQREQQEAQQRAQQAAQQHAQQEAAQAQARQREQQEAQQRAQQAAQQHAQQEAAQAQARQREQEAQQREPEPRKPAPDRREPPRRDDPNNQNQR
jgi:hypothetical protein